VREASADSRLIQVVDALTQRHGEPEDDYLARAAAHSLALRIKRADIEDKLDPNNVKGLSNGSITRVDLASTTASSRPARATRRHRNTTDRWSRRSGTRWIQ
jgi:hypothetical protein